MKPNPQPLHIVETSNKLARTLARPFIIHWPERGVAVGKRHARKTFAVNFFRYKAGYVEIHITGARCSKKDQFSRKIGVRVVTGRLKKMEEMLVNKTTDLHAYWAANPFSNILSSTSQLDSPIFRNLSVPEDVRKYVKEIYARFIKETTEPLPAPEPVVTPTPV